ncbi:MAG: hypothetical protein LC645_02950, partial [Geobacteraceae bacterium]|nr:hypothetical protein [Geobacteraceae bacterium]
SLLFVPSIILHCILSIAYFIPDIKVTYSGTARHLTCAISNSVGNAHPTALIAHIKGAYKRLVAGHDSSLAHVILKDRVVQKRGTLRICTAQLRHRPDVKGGIAPVDSALLRN